MVELFERYETFEIDVLNLFGRLYREAFHDYLHTDIAY